ncbi:HAD family hydrolase [Peteryoungia desertarenae]|uniref:HAD family hydrolase n=1 Tax=Peteryoungia desertarenae TaxID=1813451 RepID=A0ABX6QMN1_9HYPH|nr:HAD family hydrolase [Peteryoungia desertarenae]QLF69532.1 HAD family hydrolase [Peteryoungia desertarenae]
MAAVQSIAGIVFDKDGTLLDFDASWGPVNREVALMAAAGDQDLADRLLLVCGMDPVTGDIAADSLFAAGNTVEIAEGMVAAGALLPLETLIPRIDDCFAKAAEFSVPVADLAPLFSSLHAKGLKLGIASSDNERSIRIAATRLGIIEYVDFIAGYDSGHGYKPEAGMVLGFCSATGLHPTEVAVIGDNNHDLQMGINAGAGLKIGVLSGTGSRETLSGLADCILEDVTQLEALLAAP